uniref:Uncharacterized protein n=1 Tax=Physcomitrium patens TaxID=3218 RepID=A0A2K1KN42_PHYPA|nr:hypothetical protein PHYPA_006091 [Physcomitrium patens]
MHQENTYTSNQVRPEKSFSTNTDQTPEKLHKLKIYNQSPNRQGFPRPSISQTPRNSPTPNTKKTESRSIRVLHWIACNSI